MISHEQVEQAYHQRKKEGKTRSQDLGSYEIIEAVMRQGLAEEGKIWWFAYELMGFHTIKGKRYWLSYKASTRVSEMAGEMGMVESRKSDGKLHLYRLLINELPPKQEKPRQVEVVIEEVNGQLVAVEKLK